MAEEKKITLSLSRPTDVKKPLGLSDSKVRQSFSHGKSKVVNVEVKKKKNGLVKGLKKRILKRFLAYQVFIH